MDKVNGNSTPTQEQLKTKTKTSTWHKDYDMSMIVLSAEYYVQDLPETVEEIKTHPNHTKWKAAMEEEMRAFNENNTWILVKRLLNKRVINKKWVFKVKTDKQGNVIRFKARLVVKGCSQKLGFDYMDTYTLVANIVTVRTLLSLALHKDWHIIQMNVTTAFLNGIVERELNMRQPEGFEKGENLVCKLNKSLYGLKQAPYCWNKRFNKFI